MGRPPDTRYAKSGDLHIAYQVTGSGDFDIVVVPGWISHLNYQWDELSYRRFMERLASFARVIRFDKRNMGLSDRVGDGAHRRGTSDDTASIGAVLHSTRTAFEALGMDGWQRQRHRLHTCTPMSS